MRFEARDVLSFATKKNPFNFLSTVNYFQKLISKSWFNIEVIFAFEISKSNQFDPLFFAYTKSINEFP